MMALQTTGTLPCVINNVELLYDGNLKYYLQIVFNKARNINYPYHNFRHISHVTLLCYQACVFYKETLSARQMRNLLIASLFHDFDHSGMLGDDDLNIEKSIRGLTKHILPEDKEYFGEIKKIIQATQYPYQTSSEDLGLMEQIIRDADLSQAFSVAWIQQVVFGLATEWSKRPIEVLESQTPFLRSLNFHTEWAKSTFPRETIESKIMEVRDLLEILNGSV